MNKYKVVVDVFRDTSSKHVYHKGDNFPCEDVIAQTDMSENRIKELLSDKNKMGIKLIEEELFENKTSIKKTTKRK